MVLLFLVGFYVVFYGVMGVVVCLAMFGILISLVLSVFFKVLLSPLW